MGHTLSVMGDDPLSKWSADDFDTDKEKVFLGAYSRQDLEAMFDKYLFPPLAALFPRKGFVLDVDVSDPFVHQVSVSHELLKDKPADAQFLLKLFVRRRDFDWRELKVLQPTHRCAAFDAWAVGMDLQSPFAEWPHSLAATVLEFLFLQNPLAPFRPGRKQLPGQKYPGLGIAKHVASMIMAAGTAHNRDIVFQTPQYVHNALVYARGGMKFLSPHCQAWFEILCEDMQNEIKDMFAEFAEKVHERKLRYKGEVVIWPLWEQGLPVSDLAKELFAGHAALVLEIKARPDQGTRPFFTLDN